MNLPLIMEFWSIVSVLLLFKSLFAETFGDAASLNDPEPQITDISVFQLYPLEKTVFGVGQRIRCECIANCTEEALAQIMIHINVILENSSEGSHLSAPSRTELASANASITFTADYDAGYYSVMCLDGASQEVYVQRTISVYTPPNHMKFDPEFSTVPVGNSIVCACRGFPRPVIHWAYVSGPEILQTKEDMILTEENSKYGYYVYTCTATNTVDSYSKQYKFRLTEMSSNQFLYTIVTISIFVLVILGFTLFVCYKNQWRRRTIHLYDNYSSIEG